jgi:hypothetical protein
VLVFPNRLPSLSSQIPSLVLLSPIAALRLAVLLLSVTPGAAGKDPLLHCSLFPLLHRSPFHWAERSRKGRGFVGEVPPSSAQGSTSRRREEEEEEEVRSSGRSEGGGGRADLGFS